MRLIGQSAAHGALPSLFAATAPEVVGGGLYGPDGPGQVRGHPTHRVLPAPSALDKEVAQRLWEVSEALTGIRLLLRLVKSAAEKSSAGNAPTQG